MYKQIYIRSVNSLRGFAELNICVELRKALSILVQLREHGIQIFSANQRSVIGTQDQCFEILEHLTNTRSHFCPLCTKTVLYQDKSFFLFPEQNLTVGRMFYQKTS